MQIIDIVNIIFINSSEIIFNLILRFAIAFIIAL